jgi:hypothetical protein
LLILQDITIVFESNRYKIKQTEIQYKTPKKESPLFWVFYKNISVLSTLCCHFLFAEDTVYEHRMPSRQLLAQKGLRLKVFPEAAEVGVAIKHAL